MEYINQLKEDLKELVDTEKADFLPKFFQAYPGGYGEGDEFIGVSVPDQRKVSKKYYRKLSLTAVEGLLQEPVHEYRLTALFIMIHKFERGSGEEREEIVNLYLKNTSYVNNWDLVDSSAYKILGHYLMDREKDILYKLAESEDLWQQRISMITTLHFIRNNEFADSLKLAEILLEHEHDLIHKAVGWMLREVGKRNYQLEYDFLKKHYQKMPRTMLRYAIEKFNEDVRQRFLKGEI